MGVFSKKEKKIEDPVFRRSVTIDYLRYSSKAEREKVIKIANTYVEADEQVAIIEAGSKKALKEKQSEDVDLKNIENELMD